MEVEGEDPNIGVFGIQGDASFVDHLFYSCLVFDMLSSLLMPCSHLLGKG